MVELVYAIDFGTSNSLLAAADGTKVLAAAPLDAAATDPTILKTVLFTPERNRWFFGAEAIHQYGETAAQGRIFRSIKKYLPDAAFNGTMVHDRHYNLSELIAVFLRELRERANAHYGVDARAVVLGRPAVFGERADDELAEKRLRAAAELAGFSSVAFCPEPVAAAYEFRHELTEPRMVLIADFGGGTSDFTVLRLGPERFTDRDLLAVHGVPLAGDRFDGAIMKHEIAPHFGTNVVYRLPMGSADLRLPQHLVNRLCNPADISFLGRADILQLLKDAQRWSLDKSDAKRMDNLFTLVEGYLGYELFKRIEATKIALSQESKAPFRFDQAGIDVVTEVQRADFRSYTTDLVERIMTALDETLNRAQLSPDGVDIVCCTGGTARLPQLAWELERRFGKAKLRQHRHFHSVIGGLAERAQALCQEG